MTETGTESIMSRKAIGQLMKITREAEGKTQYEVAQSLGYKHENFLSMVESGRTNIPMIRIIDFIAEYNMKSMFGLVILKATFPDAYNFFVQLITETCEMLNGKNYDEIDRAVIEFFKSQVDVYGVSVEEEKKPKKTTPKGMAAKGRTRAKDK